MHAISQGTSGTLQTLRMIDWLAAVPLREGASDSIRGVGLQNPSTLDAFLRSRWTVIPDGTFETIRTIPVQLGNIRTLGTFEGDCDDAAVVALWMLRDGVRRGVYDLARVLIVAVREPWASEFGHVYVEVFPRRGEPFIIDPVMDEGFDYFGFEKISVDAKLAMP